MTPPGGSGSRSPRTSRGVVQRWGTRAINERGGRSSVAIGAPGVVGADDETPPPPPPPPPAAPTIGLFTVDDATPLTGQPVTASWMTTGDAITAWSIDSDGDGDADYSGTTESFTTISYTSAGTITPTLSVSNASGSDSELGPTIVVSVAGSETLITKVTIENAEDADKTSELVEFGFPTHGSHLAPGQSLKVYDDNGSGGKGTLLANYQIDNIHTDNDGDQRFAKITAVVPALGRSSGGSKLRKLHVYASDDAPPTGTAITISDIQALAAYSDGLGKVTFDVGGTSYTRTLKDFFDSSPGTFAGKTGITLFSQLWQTGPVCTTWVMRAAPESGGTKHASGDGIHVVFVVSAYKAGSAAVSGGNPITAIRVDCMPENADYVRATTADYTYGLVLERATSLTDGTLISTPQDVLPLPKQVYSYPRTTPAAGISLSATSAYSTGTITRDSGVWPTDIKRRRIAASGGVAFVTSRVSDTVVNVEIQKAFGASSYTSSNWAVDPIGHDYNGRYFRRFWVGNRPTHQVAYGDNTSAVTPSTKAMHDFLASTEMIFEYDWTYAGVSHASGITLLNATNESDGSIFPMAANSVLGVHKIGEVDTDTGSTGTNPWIGWMPEWNVAALVKYDGDGKRRLWENACHWYGQSYFYPPRLAGTPTAGLLGNSPRADNGLETYWNIIGSGVTKPAGPRVPWGREMGHHPSTNYLAYLLTGDYVWFKCIQEHVDFITWDMFLTNSGSYGNGTRTSRGPLGAADGISIWGTADLATRGHAWSLRCLLQFAALQPDDERTQLMNGKTYYDYRVAERWDAAVHWVNHASMISPTTGPLYDYKKTENLTTYYRGEEVYLCTPWTMGFMGGVVASAKYLGLTDADWTTYATWLKRFWTEQVDNAGIVFDLYSTAFQHVWATKLTPNMIEPTDLPVNTAEMYRRTALLGASNQNAWGLNRLITSGNVTISDPTVGAGRTVTFPTAVFASGGTGTGAWYVGGYITTRRAGSIKIASETSNFQVGEVMTIGSGGGANVGTVTALLSDTGSDATYRVKSLTGVGQPAGGLTTTGNLGGAGVSAGDPNFNWPPLIPGVARITSVISSTQVTVEVLQAFHDTTLVPDDQVVYPAPHPDDYDGYAEAAPNDAIQYHFLFGCLAMKKVFGTTMDPPIDAMKARTGFVEWAQEKQFAIVGRT